MREYKNFVPLRLDDRDFARIKTMAQKTGKAVATVARLVLKQGLRRLSVAEVDQYLAEVPYADQPDFIHRLIRDESRTVAFLLADYTLATRRLLAAVGKEDLFPYVLTALVYEITDSNQLAASFWMPLVLSKVEAAEILGTSRRWDTLRRLILEEDAPREPRK